jgi:PhoH-like ATPase
LSKGIVNLNNVDSQVMAKLYQTAQGLSDKDLKLKNAYDNQYYVLQNKDGSAMARYQAAQKRLIPVPSHRAYGITPRNAEQNFALDALLNPDVNLVSLTGIAGTGKTLLSLAAALAQEKEYDQIMLSRPVIPLKSQEMGFLPGDIKEKLAPYMLPLMDNLSVIKGSLKPNSREYVRIEEMQRNEKLLISPLAYIRGRSLSRVFFIVDESQNLTPHEVKTIITRAGEGSKLVFTGDIHQIDQPYLDRYSNGLTYLTDKMLGQDLFAHVNLVKGERSRLAELAGNLL